MACPYMEKGFLVGFTRLLVVRQKRRAWRLQIKLRRDFDTTQCVKAAKSSNTNQMDNDLIWIDVAIDILKSFQLSLVEVHNLPHPQFRRPLRSCRMLAGCRNKISHSFAGHICGSDMVTPLQKWPVNDDLINFFGRWYVSEIDIGMVTLRDYPMRWMGTCSMYDSSNDSSV